MPQLCAKHVLQLNLSVQTKSDQEKEVVMEMKVRDQEEEQISWQMNPSAGIVDTKSCTTPNPLTAHSLGIYFEGVMQHAMKESLEEYALGVQRSY